MIILGLNKKNEIFYAYTEDRSKVTHLLSAIKAGKVTNGMFYKEYTVIVKERDTGDYYFFYDEYKTIKQARQVSKVLLKAVLQANTITLANQSIYNDAEHIILHNAKNIIHNLTTGLRSQLNYETLVYQDDKVQFINYLVENNTLNYARELLRCEKALEQISYEYNCLDFIKSGELLDSTERTREKLHSCLVQAFYIYENDFNEKKMYVCIDKNFNTVFCNFFSLRSAFSLIFENCTKYCKEGTEIDIDICVQSDCSIKIDFDMCSVYNSDDELELIFLEYQRGEEARRKGSGQGLGLFLVRRLLEINGFSIVMKRVSDSDSYDENGIHYCRNLFVIDIPSEYIAKD